jgi:hypothetical protein
VVFMCYVSGECMSRALMGEMNFHHPSHPLHTNKRFNRLIASPGERKPHGLGLPHDIDIWNQPAISRDSLPHGTQCM